MKKMVQTIDSIRENGILVPIMVRERQEGGYEIISGHRRKYAADMVDAKKIKFNPAVELSYLSSHEQFTLLEVMKEDNVVPSLSQAQQIKRLAQEGNCTKEAIHAILAVAGIKERNVVIKHEVIMQYFSADTSDAEIESLIVRLLEDYKRKHGGM